MHLLALALICWIAAGCFGVAHLANSGREQAKVNHFDFVRMENLEDLIFKNKQAIGATQKAVEAIVKQVELNAHLEDERVGGLQKAFESHRTSLQAHKKLPKGRAR